MIADFTTNSPRRTYFGVFAVLYLITQVPIYLTDTLPLQDYANHLARMHILAHGTSADDLQRFYDIHWAVIPNLAMDLLVPQLTKIISLELAGKLFISLSFLLIASGTIAINHALYRRLSLWPLLGFLFLYNRYFLWGFVNYLFGVGLALWGIAAWIYLRDRSTALRLALFSIIASALFIAHLYALGFYAVTVVAYEAAKHLRRGWIAGLPPHSIWVPALGQFAVPAVAFVVLTPHHHKAAKAIVFQGFSEHIIGKLAGLVSVLHNYNPVLDGLTYAALLALLAIALRKRMFTIHPDMYTPLALLGVIYLIMPFMLMESGMADRRLFVAIAFLFIASSDLRLTKPNVDLALAASAVVILVMFLLRMAVLSYYWQIADSKYAEYLAAFDILPKGSRLFVASLPSPPQKDYKIFLPTEHIPCLAVIRRDAFIPTLFAAPVWPNQPIAYKPRYEQTVNFSQTAIREIRDGATPPWDTIAKLYDYVLLVGSGPITTLPPQLVPVYQGRSIYMYKVVNAVAH